MQIVLDRREYSELLKDFQRVKGVVTRDVPLLTVASIAIIGRADADRKLQTVISMGKAHYKNGKYKVWSKKNDLGAWSSTTRKDSKGGPWMLSRYTWETVKGKKRMERNPFVQAAFTSTIANLLNYDTKPYGKNSPYFGLSDGRMARIPKGRVRKGRSEIFTIIYTSLYNAEAQGIARAERKLLKEIS